MSVGRCGVNIVKDALFDMLVYTRAVRVFAVDDIFGRPWNSNGLVLYLFISTCVGVFLLLLIFLWLD